MAGKQGAGAASDWVCQGSFACNFAAARAPKQHPLSSTKTPPLTCVPAGSFSCRMRTTGCMATPVAHTHAPKGISDSCEERKGGAQTTVLSGPHACAKGNLRLRLREGRRRQARRWSGTAACFAGSARQTRGLGRQRPHARHALGRHLHATPVQAINGPHTRNSRCPTCQPRPPRRPEPA